MVSFFGNTVSSYTRSQLRKHYKSKAQRKKEDDDFQHSIREKKKYLQDPKSSEGWGYW